MIGRMYALFFLIALTIAFPPLMIFTVPLIVVVIRRGRRARKRIRDEHTAKARDREERAFIQAMRSFRD